MSFAKLPNTDWACSAMDVTYSGTLNGYEETGVKFDYPGCLTTVTAPKSAAYTCGSLQLKNVNDTSVTFGRFQVSSSSSYFFAVFVLCLASYTVITMLLNIPFNTIYLQAKVLGNSFFVWTLNKVLL